MLLFDISKVAYSHPLVPYKAIFPSLTRTPFLQLMTDAGIGLFSNLITFSACDVLRKTY